jgi:solute carrier family 25, member 44
MSNNNDTNSRISNRPNLNHIDWDHIDYKKFYTIGPALFFAVRALTYPPALIKTRLQAQVFRTTPLESNKTSTTCTTRTVGGSASSSAKATKTPTTTQATTIRRGQYKNTLDAFRTIIKTDGPLALWQGFLPKTIGLVGGNVYISCYELFRSRLLKSNCSTFTSDVVAGGAASLISQTMIVPIDLVSQRMAVDLDGRSFGSHLRAVWKEAGFYGLYRGFIPSVMTYAPASSIWWSTYSFTKPHAVEPVGRFLNFCTPTDSEPSEWTMERCTESLCGGISGATAGLLTNPMDVIKVRRQLSANEVRTRHLIIDLYQCEGLLGFTRGASARVLNMSPSGALIVTVYELIKRLSRKEE